MSDGLDVIIVDDDKGICDVIRELVENFYTWGNVISFSDADSAIEHCLNRDVQHWDIAAAMIPYRSTFPRHAHWVAAG